APGLEDRRQDLDVLRPSRRIDGAITRVLPDPVEGPRMAADQGEHVSLLEGDVHPLSRGKLARVSKNRRDEIEADDSVAMTREEPGIVAAAATGDGYRPPGWGLACKVGSETGARPAQLPAVAPLIVEALPEPCAARVRP